MAYRLVGARKFLNVAKPGTIFIPIDFYHYGKADENTAEKIVQEFKENPKNSYNTRWDLLRIFISNGGSITFYYDMINCNEDDDYIYHYDYNVVGDADPESALYLIVNSIEDIPDHINFYCYGNKINIPEFDKDLVMYNNKERVYEHYLNLSKEEIKQRYKKIINDYYSDGLINIDDNEWAKKELSVLDNPVLDVDIEVE